MSDDLDDLLRRTMKTLDDQVPSGYFDALPERVSARLAGTGEANMQQGTESSKNQAPVVAGGQPPVSTPVTPQKPTMTAVASGTGALPTVPAAASPEAP